MYETFHTANVDNSAIALGDAQDQKHEGNDISKNKPHLRESTSLYESAKQSFITAHGDE
jgi:hypothetical protein